MSVDFDPSRLGPLDNVTTTPAQRDAARLYVCGAAKDADDAALLLDALGLGAATQ